MRPTCACHGEPMTIRNDRSVGWRCSVRHRGAKNAYWHRRMDTDREFRLRERDRLASLKRCQTIRRMEEEILG